MTPQERKAWKRKQLEKRGWSEKRIEAFMRSYNFQYSTKTSRKRNAS